MPRFSILVPVYNQFWNLRKNFESLVKQTYGDYEICVLDDGSFDSSSSVLNAYASANSHIHLKRHHKTLGLGQTKNDLVAMASGQYLLFVSPADCLDLDFLAWIDYNLEAGDVDILKIQSAPNNGSEPLRLDNFVLKSGEECLLSWCGGWQSPDLDSWSYVMRRELFSDAIFPDTSLLEDYAIIPYLVAKALRAKEIIYNGICHVPYDDSTPDNLSFEEALERKDKNLRLLANMNALSRSLIAKTRISNITKNAYFDVLQERYDLLLEDFMAFQATQGDSKPRC